MSGLGEYLAEDDRHALGMAREVVAKLSIPRRRNPARMPWDRACGMSVCGARSRTRSERIYREVKVMMIGGGAEEVMKDLAARQLGL